MRRRSHNYSNENTTSENINYDDKYVNSGESEFSRDMTIPFDENEVLSERHFVIGDGGQDHYGKGPKGYRRADGSIYEEVCQALWRSPQVDPREIEVKVDGGVVTLSGTVHKREFKRWAERLVEDVPGVEDVRNEITVDPDSGGLVQNRTGMI
ncbi:MAG TPA: BON domain-containing protein [Bacteriovoracaceae bacterium]|nr:BON domain-containing protein [Bacteriovoracaceae bacterium]